MGRRLYYTVREPVEKFTRHILFNSLLQKRLLRLQVKRMELFFLDLFSLFQTQHYHHPHMGIQAV